MMKSYFTEIYNHNKRTTLFFVLSLILIILSACNSEAPDDPISFQVSVNINGQIKTVNTLPGTSVKTILDLENIELGNLDKVNPPLHSEISQPIEIEVVRVTESFQTEDSIIAFETQTIKNETLPEGQTYLVQAGVNGVLQVTKRILSENDTEVSKSVFKTDVIQEALPEIIMVGVQTPFTSMSITGTLCYLTAGNAWLMEDSTGNRRPLVTSGDLDGRVFSLSDNGEWLLFTRSEGSENLINSLWMINVEEDSEAIDLRINNVVHFAEWIPGRSLAVSYSTVETRSSPPGWQANNDLHITIFNPSGIILSQEEIIEANSGGIYGWWGTEFNWSPDGAQLAYARPDSIGWVDFENNEFVPVVDLIPYQTRSDWAWVPGTGWADDHSILYTVIHNTGSDSSYNEATPNFDLAAISFSNDGAVIPMIQEAGMFAYPAPSPLSESNRFRLAYLQAIFPEQSETSRYKLNLMDQDGSNKQTLFPFEGSSGIEPQEIVWSPEKDIRNQTIGLIYKNNLWILDIQTGDANQITGDNSIQIIDWK